MKKLFLIVLIILCIYIVSIDIACTKVKISNWENWDKELPSIDNEYWDAFGPDNEPQNIIL
jgi:hypothetical protein